MRTIRKFVNFIIILLFVLILLIMIRRESMLFYIYKDINLDSNRIFLLSSLVIQITVGAIASIFGILIAVYLLSSQLVNRSPYSRFVNSFYKKSDILYLLLLFSSIVFPVFILVYWDSFQVSTQLYFLDVIILLFLISVLSLLSIIIKHFGIFNPRQVAMSVLDIFKKRSILTYGLIRVEKNSYDKNLKYELKTWGHRHNLIDPLGSFHDIIMETINSKERISFHLFLSVLVEKVAHLCGVRFHRQFGIANKKDRDLFNSHLNLPVLFYAYKIEHRVQILIHALHYLVRRANKITHEWGIDNHRQIFIINLADLILALSNKKSNGILIEICLYAILRICIDFKDVKIYGSYEPLSDLFNLSNYLNKIGFQRESNICLSILAYIDINTPYISNNPNLHIDDILEKLSAETVIIYNNLKSSLKGQSTSDAFKRNIWNW